jgi:S-adenosylmethionine-diacylgycerolhomoserine-N-methlytransferase
MRETASHEHMQLMDRLYRPMKSTYDLTRPLFLAGRAALRAECARTRPRRVAEMGAGTARNLILLARALPQTDFVGVEISTQMSDYARARIAQAGLSGRIAVAQADAAAPPPLGAPDVAFFSYSLSMIPDWRGALNAAGESLAPEGRLLILDFADMRGWLPWFRSRLAKNLAYFHVEPRHDLEPWLRAHPTFSRWDRSRRDFFGGYASLTELRAPC